MDFDPLAALAGIGVDETRAKGQLLAKPSVRYRKTINTWNPRANWGEGGEESVNAQHYAILVTDVQQPYDAHDPTKWVPGGRAAKREGRGGPWDAPSGCHQRGQRKAGGMGPSN